jgi:hypothetical protein
MPHHHKPDRSEEIQEKILETDREILKELRKIEHDVHPHRYTILIQQEHHTWLSRTELS